MHYVYLLRSLSHPDQRYVGFTADTAHPLAGPARGRKPSVDFCGDRQRRRPAYGLGGGPLGGSRCFVRDTAIMSPRPIMTSAPTPIQACGTWSKNAP